MSSKKVFMGGKDNNLDMAIEAMGNTSTKVNQQLKINFMYRGCVMAETKAARTTSAVRTATLLNYSVILSHNNLTSNITFW